MLKKIMPLILSVFILTISINYSLAEPTLKGKYGDWNVFINYDTDNHMCFVASQPTKQLPSTKNWDPTFYITRYGKIIGEPSINAGYNYRKDSQASVKILEYVFQLGTNGQGAWLGTVEEELKLIDAMKKGASMIIKGESEFNTLTTDTYSLKGVTRSIEEMNKLCPIK